MIRNLPAVLITTAGLLASSALASAASTSTIGTFSRGAAMVLQDRNVRDLGEVNRNDRSSFTVVLQNRDRPGLAAFNQAVTDPRSPMFGHYLSEAQFQEAFGPTRAEQLFVAHSLAAAGFLVDASDSTFSSVRATGQSSTAENFFNVRIHRLVRNGRIEHLNLQEPRMPAAIAPIALAAFGLNETVEIKPALLRQMNSQTMDIGALGSTPAYGPATGSAGGLGPSPISQYFNLPNLKGYNGSGKTIGIVIATNYSPSDLASYQSYFQVPVAPNITVVAIDGGGTFHTTGNDSIEADLDVETVYGLAPGAAIRVYSNADAGNGSLSTQSEYDSINAAVNKPVDVVSVSYGGCELSDESFDNSVDAAANSGTAKGVTIVAASGDQGYGGCGGSTNQSQANFPASDTFVTAAGGIQSNSSNAITSPSGWSGSGGYGSRYYPKPTYQKGLTLGTARVVPDIALLGGSPGFAEFYQGSQTAMEGTSEATPEFAAGLAEIEQQRGTNYGFANKSLLYNAYGAYGYSNLLNDITTGNNGQPAQAGWDFVTGIGTPNFENLESVAPSCCT